MATVREVSVSFKGTLPTQPFGGVTIELSWQADLNPDDDPETVSRDLFERVRGEVIRAVTPIAQAKMNNIDRALAKLPARQREVFKANLGPLEWLYAVSPAAALADSELDTAPAERLSRRPRQPVPHDNKEVTPA